MENFNTYFYNVNKERFGSLIGLIPIQVGMEIESRNRNYKVEHIKLILSDTSKNDAELGFHVYCK